MTKAKVIGVTGPRGHALEAGEVVAVLADLAAVMAGADLLHVGCASGVDALACQAAVKAGADVVMWRAEDEGPRMPHAAKLQARSKRMVRALAAAGGVLVAYPNKPCPGGVTVASWQGSGTWGTVRYAVALGCEVVVVPLAAMELPEWLTQKQGALF